MEFKRLFVLFAVFLAVSGMAMAIRAAGADGDGGFLPRWEAATSTVSNTTEGGNVSYLNLTGTSLTDRWAGFYGNISGATIYLTDDDSGTVNYLYSWAVSGGSETGEVCISTDASFDFGASSALTSANDIDTAWSFGAVADNATNTFDDGPCPVFYFEEQGVTITGAVNATHESSSTFSTCAINDTAVAAGTDLAFCAMINPSGTNYRGDTAGYELIAPTDASTPTATTTYFFFIEVN